MKMAHFAHYDVLTDLPNRTLFDDRITQAIALAHRQGMQAAVLFVDLDRFKQINDSLGHAVGDALLQSVTARCCALCGPPTRSAVTVATSSSCSSRISTSTISSASSPRKSSAL